MVSYDDWTALGKSAGALARAALALEPKVLEQHCPARLLARRRAERPLGNLVSEIKVIKGHLLANRNRPRRSKHQPVVEQCSTIVCALGVHCTWLAAVIRKAQSTEDSEALDSSAARVHSGDSHAAAAATTNPSSFSSSSTATTTSSSSSFFSSSSTATTTSSYTTRRCSSQRVIVSARHCGGARGIAIDQAQAVRVHEQSDAPPKVLLMREAIRLMREAIRLMKEALRLMREAIRVTRLPKCS